VAWVFLAVRERAQPALPDEAPQAWQPNQGAGELQAAPEAGRRADDPREPARRNEQRRLGKQAEEVPLAAPDAVPPPALVPLLRASPRRLLCEFPGAAGVVPTKPGLDGEKEKELEAGACRELPRASPG
jgi:hypothetical protein